MIWTLHRKLVVGRAGYQRCKQKKDKRKTRRCRTKPHLCRSVALFIAGLVSLIEFLVAVQRPAAFQTEQCSSHAAFLVGRAGQLPCCFSSGQCSFSCLFGATGRWRCQVGGRHLPIVSYGQSYKQTYSDTGFSEPTVFAHLNRIVSLHCRQNFQ